MRQEGVKLVFRYTRGMRQPDIHDPLVVRPVLRYDSLNGEETFQLRSNLPLLQRGAQD